jgi:hypothetical protein
VQVLGRDALTAVTRAPERVIHILRRRWLIARECRLKAITQAECGSFEERGPRTARDEDPRCAPLAERASIRHSRAW